jgi:DNA-binding IclR family transcriptional regulator
MQPARSADGHHAAARGTALLTKAFVVLRQVSRRHHTGWTLSELSAACGYSHPTVHRILLALMENGMVAKRPGTHAYVLGPAALNFGASVHPMFDLREAGQPALERLVALSEGTAFLYVRSGYDLVCIARAQGAQRARALPLEVGARRPLCLSAGGVAMMLHLSASEQAAAIRYSLTQAEPAGRQRLAAIRQMIRESRRLGFGINVDLLVPGMTGVGVPVLNASGDPVAALTLTQLSAGLAGEAIRRLAARMREEAARLAPQAAGLTAV